MQSILKGLVIAAIAAAGTTRAWAAELVPGQGAIQLLLLQQNSVEDELKLSADQKRKIADFAEQQWKKAVAVSDTAADEQHRRFGEMKTENEKFIADTLSAEQSRRLTEITLQTAGLIWITRDEIAGELKLTEDQKKQIAEIQQDARGQFKALLYDTKPEDRNKKFQDYREQARARLGHVLTDEQRDKWNRMKGEPFKGELDYGDIRVPGQPK